MLFQVERQVLIQVHHQVMCQVERLLLCLVVHPVVILVAHLQLFLVEFRVVHQVMSPVEYLVRFHLAVSSPVPLPVIPQQ